MSEDYTPGVKSRTVDAVAILRRLVDGKAKDHGHCGPRGRVVTATLKTLGHCTITGTFSIPMGQSAYAVTFSLDVLEGAMPLDIMDAAMKVARFMAEAPHFEASETPEVHAMLNQILGAY